MRVAVIGVGQIPSEECKGDVFSDQSALIAKTALADAALDIGQINNVVAGEYDLVTGRTAEHMYTVPAAGGYLKDEIRINDDGLFALAQAFMGIMAGEFETTLVISTGISSEGPQELVTNMRLAPFYHRHLGLHEKLANGMQAFQYREKYGITESQSAKVAVKNRNNALKNPFAHLRKKVTETDVLHSAFDCWPVRTLERAPWSDGGCAVVLANEPFARRICRNPVWLEGIGWSNHTYYLEDKDLSELTATKHAARAAYKMAGIEDPAGDIDVAEVYDITTYHELMACEALGFCKKGEGSRLIDEEMTVIDGKLPVNPSGGVLSSNPLSASGLARFVECVLQLRGDAKDHQVKDVKTALAHCISGYGAQRSCVVIARR
ncbi:MAG: thiolase family protein [Deltaproteobacteria bacterium]|nr:thiolase family protein [Deltaproteobacteria bacterium]